MATAWQSWLHHSLAPRVQRHDAGTIAQWLFCSSPFILIVLSLELTLRPTLCLIPSPSSPLDVSSSSLICFARLNDPFFEHVFSEHRPSRLPPSPNHQQARFSAACTCLALFTEARRRPGGDAFSRRVERMFHFCHTALRFFPARKRSQPCRITNADKTPSSPMLHYRGAANRIRDFAVCVALSRPGIVHGVSPN